MLVLNTLAAAGIWALCATTTESLTWLAGIVGVIAMMNLAFIAYIRGSGVRLGLDQFPELHQRVVELARQVGLRRTPEVYVMQQDGALNAFATRFFRSHIVVLLTDLLEACGENRAARDMIIGHELGHLRAGHLLGRWLLLPATFVPFLGSALSRAREYTCDRYGKAAAGDEEGALLGLEILAAGGRYGPLVNRAAHVRQRDALRSVWMHIGECLASHPPLSKRMLALAPDLAAPVTQYSATGPESRSSALRWLRPALSALAVLTIGVLSLSMWLPGFRARATAHHVSPAPAAGKQQVEKDLERLRSMVDADLRAGRPLPWDIYELYGRWSEVHPNEKHPIDPFNGYWYDYDQRGGAYRIWSAGPDGDGRTADDIVFDSRTAPKP